jgi:hypothetical protein
MPKGSITLEDARLVHEFAQHVQPILRHGDCIKLLEQAKTVTRISYCAIAEARQNARQNVLDKDTFRLYGGGI